MSGLSFDKKILTDIVNASFLNEDERPGRRSFRDISNFIYMEAMQNPTLASTADYLRAHTLLQLVKFGPERAAEWLDQKLSEIWDIAFDAGFLRQMVNGHIAIHGGTGMEVYSKDQAIHSAIRKFSLNGKFDSESLCLLILQAIAWSIEEFSIARNNLPALIKYHSDEPSELRNSSPEESTSLA